MRKLLTAYGDLMVTIGVWFFNRGEKYATWVKLPIDDRNPITGWDTCDTKDCHHCHCAECD